MLRKLNPAVLVVVNHSCDCLPPAAPWFDDPKITVKNFSMDIFFDGLFADTQFLHDRMTKKILARLKRFYIRKNERLLDPVVLNLVSGVVTGDGAPVHI